MIEPFPRVIDATMRSAYLLCPHYFYRRHCQGLSSQEAPSIHLHFGACLAKGLETVRRGYASGLPQGMALRSGFDAIITHWGNYPTEIVSSNRSESVKSLASCLLALDDYFMEWPLDTDPVQVAYYEGKPCIEFSFALPIPGTRHPDTGEPILYAGRFDLIGTFEGSYWGLDDKTTGRASSNWNDQWKLRGQFIGYSWGARQYGMPLAGFLVRGIQPLVGGTKLLPTTIIPMPNWKIERWLVQLHRDVERMLGCWRQQYWHKEEWPRIMDTGCYSYNRPCEFLPLCNSQHPERWESDYTVRYWNPLELKGDGDV